MSACLSLSLCLSRYQTICLFLAFSLPLNLSLSLYIYFYTFICHLCLPIWLSNSFYLLLCLSLCQHQSTLLFSSTLYITRSVSNILYFNAVKTIFLCLFIYFYVNVHFSFSVDFSLFKWLEPFFAFFRSKFICLLCKLIHSRR